MYGAADTLRRHPRLAALAVQQAEAVTRAQLEALGVEWFHIAAQIHGGRWREVVPGVIVLHCGPLPTATRRWVAVLAAGPGAALGSWTALELAGLEGWQRTAIHVVVRRGRHVPRMPGVVVHESRRHLPTDLRHRDGLPVHSVERAAVDAGAWSGAARTAAGLMAAVVQQRLSRPESLRRALDEAGRVSFRRSMFAALVDIEGGAQALSEIDFARLCRSAGLPEPSRQRIRLDTRGRRRYLDAEWTLPSGEIVVVEIDGVGHLGRNRWYDDLLREAELVLPAGHRVIRLPAGAVRLEPDRVVAILIRALTPARVSA
jgi:hypothetical protein